MKKLAVLVIVLFCLSSTVYDSYEPGYPQKSIADEGPGHFTVPSAFPTIQSALDSAMLSGAKDITIIVEEGEYRESVVAVGLRNLKLIGRKAKILPPPEFHCPDPPTDDIYPLSSIKLINCENFIVEGFVFIGDDFGEYTREGYPMGSSIFSINSSGRISNNIIFNYFDGIRIQVDNLRWMKGEISDNYIYNCVWSGIFATGSHHLTIQKNKIIFTIPKALSISVGIWTDDGGMGIISGNHITSYRAVDYHPQQEIDSGPDPWPARFNFMEELDYQVNENTFEQSAAVPRLNQIQVETGFQSRFLSEALRISNHFINVNRDRQQGNHDRMITVR